MFSYQNGRGLNRPILRPTSSVSPVWDMTSYKTWFGWGGILHKDTFIKLHPSINYLSHILNATGTLITIFYIHVCHFHCLHDIDKSWDNLHNSGYMMISSNGGDSANEHSSFAPKALATTYLLNIRSIPCSYNIVVLEWIQNENIYHMLHPVNLYLVGVVNI